MGLPVSWAGIRRHHSTTSVQSGAPSVSTALPAQLERAAREYVDAELHAIDRRRAGADGADDATIAAFDAFTRLRQALEDTR